MRNLRSRLEKAIYVAVRWAFSGAALTICAPVPQHRWHAYAWKMTCWQASFLTPFVKESHRHTLKARILNLWLGALTSTGKPFPIKLRISGAEAVYEAAHNPGGVIISGAHLPMIRLLPRALAELGNAPTVLVASQQSPPGRFVVWGMVEKMPALMPAPNVLVKVRTVLRRGGSVLMMADPHPGEPYSFQIFRLAPRVGARVVFTTWKLAHDGVIEFSFFAPPNPFCLSEKAIYENLEVLERKAKHILYGDSAPPADAARKLTDRPHSDPESD